METAAGYSRATVAGTSPAHPGTLIVQQNGDGSDGFSVNRWWISTTGGTVWTTCNASNPMCWVGGMVIPATGWLGSFTQVNWRSDPAVAASATGRTAVFANLANTTFRGPNAALPEAVVVSTSNDGGRRLLKSEFANSTNCVGDEDQESIAANLQNADQYDIVWRHKGVSFGGIYGACARRFFVTPSTGAVTWVTPPAPFPTQHVFGFGVGGLIVQSIGSLITVVYSNTDQTANNCGGTLGIVWVSITSLDGGQTWTREAVVDTNSLQRTCLPSQANGQVETGMRNFAFAIDPIGGAPGTMWAAVPTDNNIGFKIFSSTDGAASWQFRTTVGTGLGSFTFFPTLAVDDAGRVGMSFQAIGDLNDVSDITTSTWFAARTIGGSLSKAFLTAVRISGNYAPQGGNITPIQRSLGDYAGATSIFSGDLPGGGNATFMPAWTQVVSGSSAVTAALVQITP